jgi:hypothetical protein
MDKICVIVRNWDQLFFHHKEKRAVLAIAKYPYQVSKTMSWVAMDGVKKDKQEICSFDSVAEAEQVLFKMMCTKNDNGKWTYYHLENLEIEFVPINEILVEFAEEKLRG